MSFWFSQKLLSEIFLIVRRTERDIIINVQNLHVIYPLFLSDFNETWILSTAFRKRFKYQISWKSVQWEQSSSRRAGGETEGRTHMTRLVVVFRNFAKGHNKELVGLVVMFCTCMWQVACSNLCGGTGHTGVLFRVFLSQFRQLPGQYLSTRRRPSNSFPTHH